MLKADPHRKVFDQKLESAKQSRLGKQKLRSLPRSNEVISGLEPGGWGGSPGAPSSGTVIEAERCESLRSPSSTGSLRNCNYLLTAFVSLWSSLSVFLKKNKCLTFWVRMKFDRQSQAGERTMIS